MPARDPNLDLSDRIPGWGADLPERNRPAVPMEAAPPQGTGAHWDLPPQQPVTVRIHRSIEHERLTPVFGTSTPPRGLSGRLRDVAYRYSEGKMQHWLLLLFADRVDMIEGIFSDLRHGKVPNPYREMGLATEFRHNRAHAMTVLAAGLGAVALLTAWVVGRAEG